MTTDGARLTLAGVVFCTFLFFALILIWSH